MIGQLTARPAEAGSPRSPCIPGQAESPRCRCGIAPEDRHGQAYNEEAFAYFLSVERERSERSGIPFLLMLVDLAERPDVDPHIGPPLAHQLFSVLRRCVDDTDFVGWYRHQRVVGAVRLEFPNESRLDSVPLIRCRTLDTLTQCLASAIARHLQLRIHRYPTAPDASWAASHRLP